MLLVLSAASAAHSQQGRGVQLPPPGTVEVEMVRDNLFVLAGGGGNTAVFVTAGGVVVVDTKFPGWGKPILDKIRTFTDKPVTMIINTHSHGDHVSGNVEFPAIVDVVVHENAKSSMERMERREPRPTETRESLDIFKTNNYRGMPKRAFKDRISLGSGADQIDLYYFGIGHTNGDAWVVFPALRVMHAGDMFPGRSLPNIDPVNGGSGVTWPETLAKVYAAIKDVDAVIPGHSTLMTMEDIRMHSEFLRDFVAAVREAKRAGKTVDEAVSSWTRPAKYAQYPTPQPAQVRTPERCSTTSCRRAVFLDRPSQRCSVRLQADSPGPAGGHYVTVKSAFTFRRINNEDARRRRD
jgi:glyoxylase-like metal-dependent hydrolase (beta-lactamase superfamily II)